MKQIESQSLDGSSRSPNTHLTTASRSDRTKAIILGAMCLALFMTNFDGTSTDVALPQIQKNLEANVLGLQWVLNAYHLPVASLLLACGKFGDMYGRRRIFLLGVIIFTTASALCGVAPNLELLIAGRAIQGIGAAAIIPLSLTIVTATFPNLQERTKAIGIWSAVSALALMAGPALGGVFVDHLGWQSIFLFNVPLGFITFYLTFRAFKEEPTPANQPLDWMGLICSIVVIASLTYVLTQGGSWLSPSILIAIGMMGLCLVGFWIVESHSAHPVIPLSLLKNRAFAAILGTQTLVFFTSGGLFFMLSLFLQQVQGYSAAATGLCFLPMNSAIILASFMSGWVAVRLGWRFPIVSGLVMASVATLSLTRIQVDTEYGLILWNLVLSGFGGGLTIAPLATAAMNSVLSGQEGIASAVSSISIQMGGILGIAVQGAIFSRRFAADLKQSFIEWNVPADVQNRIMSESLHNLSIIPDDLLSTLSPSTLQQLIKTAFVSGLQLSLFVATLALILGVVVILTLVPKSSQLRLKNNA